MRVLAKRAIRGEQGDCRLDDVAYLRYLQHSCESGPRRNPDEWVGKLLPEETRDRAAREDVRRVAQSPFYHYLLARTLHYDEVYVSALARGIRQVVLFGAGTDTRAYRFQAELQRRGVTVFETDLEDPIRRKEGLIRSIGSFEHVKFLPLDLEHVDYGKWTGRAGVDMTTKTLLIAEGVSPYVHAKHVKRWLAFVASWGHGSILAYDFKITGIRAEVARRLRGERVFRMRRARGGICRFHEGLGFAVDQVISAEELEKRLLAYDPLCFFEGDMLVVLTTVGD